MPLGTPARRARARHHVTLAPRRGAAQCGAKRYSAVGRCVWEPVAEGGVGPVHLSPGGQCIPGRVGFGELSTRGKWEPSAARASAASHDSVLSGYAQIPSLYAQRACTRAPALRQQSGLSYFMCIVLAFFVVFLARVTTPRSRKMQKLNPRPSMVSAAVCVCVSGTQPFARAGRAISHTGGRARKVQPICSHPYARTHAVCVPGDTGPHARTRTFD